LEKAPKSFQLPASKDIPAQIAKCKELIEILKQKIREGEMERMEDKK